MRSRARLVGLVALVAVAAAAAPPIARWALWSRELNPVLRGRLLAEEQGCFHCHRPPGAREIANPGSRWGSVPRFGAGNAMMYVASPDEIEETIRYGAPRAWLDDASVVERLERQHLRMPAYGEVLAEPEIRDLAAFARAVEGMGVELADEAAEGRRLAREHGCLACHGVEGSGGLANPGSIGGFIPGFVGGNFTDLVRDEAEFAEWVLDGTSRRLEANPMVRWFWRRQRLAMPAYRGDLEDAEVAQIWAWVVAVRGGADEREGG